MERTTSKFGRAAGSAAMAALAACALAGCAHFSSSEDQPVASSDEGGYYVDHAAAGSVGGVGNYAFKPGQRGMTGHPLSQSGTDTSKYADYSTTRAHGGVSNYTEPGDHREMAGVVSVPADTRWDTNRDLKDTLSQLDRDLTFDTGSAEISPAAKKDLDHLAVILADDPAAEVRIHGYTDSVGSMAYNDALSKRRARAVSEVLIQDGIGADRISAHGFGESGPLASNSSAEGRQENRRADVVVVEAG